MLIDYTYMMKENNHYDLTSRFGLTDFFGGTESECFYTFVVALVRSQNDAPKFYHLILQSRKYKSF